MFHASSRREIRRDWVCIALTLLAASSCSDSRAAARTSEPPAPTSWSLAKTPLANGDLQADTVLATIAPLQVLVRANDLPAAGARVIWKVSSDTAVTTSTTATDQNGIATLQFALGPRAGAYVAVAALDSVPGVAAVTFNLSAAPGNPAVLALVSGANQTDSATAVLKSDFVVRVADAHGNGVPGVTIQWAVTTGGGSISPTSSVTTAPDGQANAKLTLGRTAASNSAMATALGIDGPIAFSATATAAHAAQLAVISGDGQVAAVSQRLGTDDIVRVTDSYGNAVAGVTIDWAIANGGGALSASTSITSSDGTATTRSTLGPTPGTQTIVAAVDAAASVARVSFSATGVTSVSPPSGSPPPPPPPPSGPAQTLVLLSGDGQTGSVGSALPNLIVVQARDADGHGVRGQQISFTAGGTGAAVPAIAVTDDDGKAATSWRFGGDQGPQTLTVQASFTATCPHRSRDRDPGSARDRRRSIGQLRRAVRLDRHRPIRQRPGRPSRFAGAGIAADGQLFAQLLSHQRPGERDHRHGRDLSGVSHIRNFGGNGDTHCISGGIHFSEPRILRRPWDARFRAHRVSSEFAEGGWHERRRSLLVRAQLEFQPSLRGYDVRAGAKRERQLLDGGGAFHAHYLGYDSRGRFLHPLRRPWPGRGRGDYHHLESELPNARHESHGETVMTRGSNVL